jgi:hypothetical protein
LISSQRQSTEETSASNHIPKDLLFFGQIGECCVHDPASIIFIMNFAGLGVRKTVLMPVCRVPPLFPARMTKPHCYSRSIFLYTEICHEGRVPATRRRRLLRKRRLWQKFLKGQRHNVLYQVPAGRTFEIFLSPILKCPPWHLHILKP